MDILPREDGALIALHEATAGGLTLGSRLTILPGFAGVVVKDGKALDTLPPGEHTLEPSLLPGLTQKVKPRFGPGQNPDNAAPLLAAMFLVPVSLPVSLPWRTQAILSRNLAYGLTYTTLEGRWYGPDRGPGPLLRRRLPGGRQGAVCGAGVPRSGRAGVPSPGHTRTGRRSRWGDEPAA